MNTFYITLSSPQGKLSSYSYSLQEKRNNTIKASNSGTNSYGEGWTTPVNFTGFPINTQVILNVSYKDSNNNNNTYQYILTVGNFTGTLIGNKDNAFNLSFFDRMIIATMLIILLGGISYFFGGAEAGGVMVIFIFGYLTATGILNVYVGSAAAILGFIVLVWRAQL